MSGKQEKLLVRRIKEITTPLSVVVIKTILVLMSSRQHTYQGWENALVALT